MHRIVVPSRRNDRIESLLAVAGRRVGQGLDKFKHRFELIVDPGGVGSLGLASAELLQAEAAEIAKSVLFLASDQSSFSTGSVFMADGGLNA